MIQLKRFTKQLICSAGLLAAALLAGCGSGDQGRDPILGVPAATLASIAVTPATASVAIGAKQQFTATASYSDGSARDISANAAWTSATTAVGTVGATGLATGLRAGTTLITAAFEGKNGTATLTVQPATVLSLALTPALTSFQVGASRQLAVVAHLFGRHRRRRHRDRSLHVGHAGVGQPSAAGGLIPGVASGQLGTERQFRRQDRQCARPRSTLATVANIAVTPANAIVAVGGVAAIHRRRHLLGQLDRHRHPHRGMDLGEPAPLPRSRTPASPPASQQAPPRSAPAVNGKSGSANLTVTALATPPALRQSHAVNLRSAANFAVLAGTALTNNSGGTTLIGGNVGSPSQTTDPKLADGFINYKSGAILANALADLQTAITDANSRSCDVTFAGDIDLGGLALPPGVYCYAGTISVTGTLNLNGSGVYIFRTALTLNTTANSIVALGNGATADNVIWVPVGPTTLGANSVFKGRILGQSAAITVGDNATLLNGRVLSAAAVTLQQ